MGRYQHCPDGCNVLSAYRTLTCYFIVGLGIPYLSFHLTASGPYLFDQEHCMTELVRKAM